MISIIIPAHNEEASITRCLTQLVNRSTYDDFNIIVVCNGCTDNSAALVKEIDSKIICLETTVASKTNAINLGDKKAIHYPRIYLDADISLTPDAAMAMRSTLQESWLATSLEPKIDVSNSSWAVKAFYNIWLRLPYCKAGMIGSGVYALSEAGRARFDQFPDVIADDGYIRCLFKENERTVTKGHYANVTAPKDLWSLIKIKTRSRLGRYQLREKFPELLANEEKNYSAAFGNLLLDFRLWPELSVYFFINFVSRLRARYQYLIRPIRWERDDSSRS